MDGRRNSGLNSYVFSVSAALVLFFVIMGVFFTKKLTDIFTSLQDLIVSNFGWFYILSVAFFLIFVIWLYLSPYGTIRLGNSSDRPEYRDTTWFAMLFSAGMGIGLLFYSVAEPIIHLASPREAAPGTVEAAVEAMNITFFHWGLHAWAIYIIVGLALAYFSYRHDMPLTIRSTMYPIFGDRIYGVRGNIVEVLAIFGTLFGVATSLGLGVMQINSGMDYLGLMSVSVNNQIILIAFITLAATTSVMSGLNRGIRILSQMNILLGLILVVFVFIVGPSVFLLSSYVQSIGYYLQHIVSLTFQTDAFTGIEWQKTWTMFYWGWWISWSPFVGMFIARISKGRTIREFIRGVLLAPVLVTFIWIIVFGNTAIHMEIFGNGGIVQAVQTSIPTALYVLLDGLPGSLLSSALATIVVMTFFVTSSDSGSLVISILSSEGNPKPAKPLRLFWSLLQGAVAAVLLLTGGLIGLQTAALTTALPFCIVLILMCYSIYKGLKAESDGKSISELENRSPEGTSDNKAKQMIGELLGGEADE
ncbi:MAG: high-affinity choline transport protein [Methanolobus sp. T82-4]|nr:MAG: high-affinity choline transport protein [Methanolobus sp. T82-4]